MVFVTAVFVAGGILAAALDLADADRWDATTLQAWTLLAQALVAVGLFLLGRWRRSVSFALLGVLIALIVVEEAFHVLNPVSAWLSDVANIENRWNTFRLSVLNGALIYGFVAVIGVALLLFSHWHGSPAERRVVRNIAVLLFVGGLFGGPVSTASYWTDDPRRIIFIEEVGENMVFAVMVGYVSALLVFARRRRSSATPVIRHRRVRGRERL
jgi:hypothetical protein